MTQEEKQLLLVDLCVRLPYGVIVSCKIVNYNIEEDAHDNHPNHTIHPEYNGNGVLYLIDCLTNRVQIRPLLKGLDYKEQVYFEHISNNGYASIDYCKPYLRSMSSMTEEEKKEYDSFLFDNLERENVIGYEDKAFGIDVIMRYRSWQVVQWLLKHHLDFNGLIDVYGLALEAPEGMYKF